MLCRFCHLAAALAPAILLTSALQAGPTADQREAEKLVQEALHRETLGLTHERAALLREAEAKAPRSAAVQWALGNVKSENRWIKADEFGSQAQQAVSYRTYLTKRSTYPETADGQCELAQWCLKHDLPDQARAHFTRALEFDSNHPLARERLGFVRMQNRWISLTEINATTQQADKARADMARWQPVIAEIREGLLSPAKFRQERAKKELAALQDETALTAIEALLFDHHDLALAAISTVAKLTSAAATQTLARQAVFANWADVRVAAGNELRERDFEDYVPLLLASLYTPIQSSLRATTDQQGRLILQQVLTREGQEQHEVLALGTAYRRIAINDKNAGETMSRAVRQLQQQGQGSLQAVQNSNLQTERLNESIIAALTVGTQANVEATPHAWWQWWNDYNELFLPDSKGTVSRTLTQEISIVDRPSASQVADTMQSLGISSRRLDCLAAGTPVWTAQGIVAIEEVRVGDLVLSQNVDTGELTYKPVLQTTIRPAGPLVRIESGKETHLETSGGHLFFVSGEGWCKARELKSGMQLHTACGTHTVSAVYDGPTAPTYNLVVADFHTYFAGYDKVLSHDNTLRRPTQAIVPGLLVK